MPQFQRIYRIVCVLVFLALYASAAESSVEQKAIYTARTTTSFHLREAPNSTRRIANVPKSVRVEVLVYDEEWSYLRYQGKTGYAQTSWLREFISLDPVHNPLPGHTPCTGIWTVNRRLTVETDAFPGAVLTKNMVVSVRKEAESFLLPVWRSSTVLPSSSGTYTAFVPWETAESGDLIAGFTTFYAKTDGEPLAKERQKNIALACELISQVNLAPGDTFSFNRVCGPYSAKKGYLPANIIGSTGTGTGGGVCQVSTTLYNAVLELPLRITDWSVHTVKGVKYVPIAFDACVGTYSDMCFENTLPFPIRLEAFPQDGALTVLLWHGGTLN